MTRPVRPRLSRAAILDAARVLADTHGLDGVTLRRVAAELDTGQASLYRHIADRRQLLVLLAEDVVAGFPVADPGLPPERRLLARWIGVHRHLAGHRWVAGVIAEGELTSANAARFARDQVADLVAAGMGPDEAPVAYRALFNLILGYLLNRHPMGHDGAYTPPEGPDDECEWALRRMLAACLGRAPDGP